MTLRDPIAGDAPYQPLVHVEELQAEVKRLRKDRDGWLRATQAVDRYLCALVADGDELKRSHVETIAAIVTERDTAVAHLDDADKEVKRLRGELAERWKADNCKFERIGFLGEERDSLRDRLHDAVKVAKYAESRLAQIQGIASDHADGAEDAHPSDREMSRIVTICQGERTP